jgi:cysteine-rich repeat protein
VDPGEGCDLGLENRLLPAFGVSQAGVAELPVAPVARPRSASEFYDYTSASAHTSFEEVGVCNLFLQVDTRTNVLGLLLIAGRDALGGGSQPEAAFDGVLRGVPPSSRLVVSDDPGEFTRTSLNDYAGRWSFNNNTDGGALDTLPWDTSWRVTVEVTFLRGVSAWRYQNNAGGPIRLEPSRAAVLIHRTGPSACRPDCQVPRCGDGFTDGGERCDDGNTVGGDACAGDCQRILR